MENGLVNGSNGSFENLYLDFSLTTDATKLLNQSADKYADKQHFIVALSTTVFLALCMITGMLGDSLVCYYYAYKIRKRTTNDIYIIVLSIADLIVCNVPMPFKLYRYNLFYCLNERYFCKVERLLTYICVTGSGAVLTLIAADRYNHICRPLAKQTGQRISLLITIMYSILVSLPSFFLYDLVKVGKEAVYSNKDNRFMCDEAIGVHMSKFIHIYNGTIGVLILLHDVITFSFYGKIICVVSKHAKMRNRFHTENKHTYPQLQPPPTEIKLPSEKNEEKVNKTIENPDQGKHDQGANNKQDGEVDNKQKVKEECLVHLKDSPQPRKKMKHVYKREMSGFKVAKIMFAVTIAFSVSFLPYICLAIWRNATAQNGMPPMSDIGRAFYELGFISYFLNSMTNPIIYGYFNDGFRSFLLTSFCLCYRKSTI